MTRYDSTRNWSASQRQARWLSANGNSRVQPMAKANTTPALAKIGFVLIAIAFAGMWFV